uniref:Methylmalonyl-CoA epimerase n=1 Tax=Naja naja TaxID=35670 RepID=A0A8C6VMX2_NAJNA
MAAFKGLFTRLQWRSPTVRRSSDQAIPQPLWKLGQLNHVAIAVPDLEKATALYRDVLRASVSEVLPLPDHGVYTVFVQLGNTKLELLHPLGEKSPIRGFLQKNKAGGSITSAWRYFLGFVSEKILSKICFRNAGSPWITTAHSVTRVTKSHLGLFFTLVTLAASPRIMRSKFSHLATDSYL